LVLTKLGLHGPKKGKDFWTGKAEELPDGQPLELPGHDVLLVRITVPK
jgi:hypothetical protein